jgi:hypothetical protein
LAVLLGIVLPRSRSCVCCLLGHGRFYLFLVPGGVNPARFAILSSRGMESARVLAAASQGRERCTFALSYIISLFFESAEPGLALWWPHTSNHTTVSAVEICQTTASKNSSKNDNNNNPLLLLILLLLGTARKEIKGHPLTTLRRESLDTKSFGYIWRPILFDCLLPFYSLCQHS